ncbi:MAG: type III pantothenate kinase [Pseudomonadales bacterium]|nr:type III pantothenate kinase [Pseudomonadales bacterium]
MSTQKSESPPLQLLLDVGNTRCKWQLRNARGKAMAAAASSGELQQIPASIAGIMREGGFQPADLQRVRVAAVRSEADQQTLAQALRATFACPVDFAHTQSETLGLKNSYRQPLHMGVDRWCAVIAAATEAGIPGADSDACVVDAGSAVTVDWINHQGQHIGGYITPGYAMQLRSLLSETGKVFAQPQAAAGDIEPGSDTHSAVHNGILAAIVAHIKSSIDRQGAQQPAEVALYLTGGDATLLLPHLQNLSLKPMHRPDLVLDGLALLLP